MSIRTKIFLIIGASQFILVLVMAISFTYLILSIKDEPQKKRAKEHILLFERELEQKQQKQELVLTNIVKNPEAVRLIGDGFDDRKILLNNLPYFQGMMKIYNLDIFELGDSKGKVWMRFHQSDSFGDDKSYQKIIDSALSGNKATALEVGNHGLALRTVIPYSDFGTLMIGQKVDQDFLAEMSYGKDFHLALLQDDVLIAASDDLIRNFIEKFPVKNNSGTRKQFDERYYYSVLVPYDDGGLSSIKLNFLVLLDETELASMVSKAWWSIGIISSLILIVIFVISYLFSRDILKALRVLVNSMKEFKDEEDRGLVSLVEKRKDEIGDMAGIFLGMKSDLGAYQYHLQELVEIKTNELQLSNQKLDHANEVLRSKQMQVEHEFMVAQNLQSHLLPEANRLIGPMQIRCLYLPASGVSGDIYDFGMLGEKECYFFMADVSGHGVPAAMVTAMIKISLSKIPIRTSTPAQILQLLNEEMVPILDDHYFTAIMCKVDFQRRVLQYANAGATPGLLLRSMRDQVKILKPTGSIMGVFESLELNDNEIRLEPGDKLFLFTDGVSEEPDESKRLFGIRKIIKLIRKERFTANNEILKILHSELVYHSGSSNFQDDVTCMIANIG